MAPAYSGLRLSRSFGFSPGFDRQVFFIPSFASAKGDYIHEPHLTSTFTLEQIKTENKHPFPGTFISSIIFIWVNKIPGLCCWCFQHILNVLEMFSTHASDLPGNVQSFTKIRCFSHILNKAPSACWFFLHRLKVLLNPFIPFFSVFWMLKRQSQVCRNTINWAGVSFKL